MNDIEQLRKNLVAVFDQQPWHGGSSIKRVLGEINPEVAFERPVNGAHSIAEIVAHILFWRKIVQKQLANTPVLQVDNEETFRWELYGKNNRQVWETMIKELDKNQHEILNLLPGLTPENLDEKVAGQKYTIREIIEGVIQHDVYHLGQIRLIFKYFSKS